MICIKRINTIQKQFLLFIVSSVLSAQSMAQIVSQNDFFELSFEELMQVDITIATKTLVSIDDVPGIVSILNASDLQRRGYDTLWDALGGMPGIQISIGSTGDRLLIIRGIGKTYSSGKVKMLLNGVAINSTLNASAEALLSLPVQQIKRVELIRGPGSAVHGEFSYAGVVNVITKQSGQGLYSVVEQNNSTRIGGHYQWQVNDVNASINFSTSQSDGADLESGLDEGSLHFGIPGYSSGPVNTKRLSNNLFLQLNYQNLNVSLQWLEAKRGDFFGINDYLPPDERKTRITDDVLSLHSDINVELNPSLTFNAGFNWLKSSTDKKQQFVESPLVSGGLASDPDVLSNVHVAEQRVELNLNLTSTAVHNHVLFAELSLAKIEVDKAEQFLNFDPITDLPSHTFYSYPTPVTNDQQRDIVSLTLQNEFTLNEALILTSGIRYDQYDNNIGSSTTPRIAMVYHATEQHSFRAQYAEAFRPPTFLEIGGALTGSIAPETKQTFEIGHHFQNDTISFKSVLFQSELKNLISFVNVRPFGFSNTDKASLLGLEFEYIHKINEKLNLDANLSLLETEDKQTGEEIYGASSVLANAKVDYKISSKVGVISSFSYVGKRDREVTDPRATMGDYLQSNVSLSVQKLADVTGLSLSVGINNIFNQDIRFQSGIDTYAEDYPMSDSRSLWLHIGYEID